MFGSILKKKKRTLPIDFSALKTDVHSHLIPAIDDGSASLEDSLALVRRFSEMGYKKLITTPHVMADYYQNTPDIILSGVEKLRKAINREGISIEIEAAAEYYIDAGLNEKIKNKQLLTFGKNHVLFEMSFLDKPQNLHDIIFSLQTAGYIPVLAHPERYWFFHKRYDSYHQLKEMGVKLQLNINSLTPHYSHQVKKIAERLIDDNLISLLGSDCHRMQHIELMQKAATNRYFRQLVEGGGLLNKEL